jgi:CBS domain containing-hemolysin-like protein
MVGSSKSRLALKRQLLFALLMSLVTVNIVSIAILLIHGVPVALLFEKWLTSIVVAWPIVFISILLVAPYLLRLTERLIKDQDQ